ncbi:Major Facilitator Superfamily protein [Natronoarchaeum philippinense]|uniref:Major Facilitator Superfamily protein n=1 Tax=Natronoarchaeum philippinense TaxID=558529 RepID=A0A285PCG9_NATPI|nr:MFS transporter [Natronoarchaeum philippinense]SNZ17826.1 Major Facilitator Superfamily protein [Natronoarchaeum philippinense]
MATEPADGNEPDAFDPFRQFFALERDVLVLSLAMFAFSLGFQMTSRFLPEYLVALGGSGVVVGAYSTVGNVISAAYPYPGGAVSDRIGSRYALTLFGLLSTVGFALWLVAPQLGAISLFGATIPAWVWIFVGLFLAQAWKSFGLGATFAVVKQATAPSKLAAGFASTETFRRTAFLVGPVLAAALIGLHPDFTVSFQYVLAVGVAFGILGTLAQHFLYEAEEDSIGDTFEGVDQIREDLRAMPSQLRPLLIADTLVRFANGMVYAFFILVVTQFLAVGVSTTLATPFGSWAIDLSPASFFGYLLGVEMAVALLVMLPAAKLAERVGLKPVVATGFLVYAVFPVLLIVAPASPAALIALFAFSGLRFAGLPSHKALIVGPAEQGTGGRVTGSYYLVRNVVVIPSGLLGGILWEGLANPLTGATLFEGSPTVAFGVATVVGLVGTAYFVLFGEEFGPYAHGNDA